MNKRQISPQRKGVYRGGQIVAVLGVLMFLSTFVSAISSFGDFTNFESRTKSMGFRALGGMVAVMVGFGMMGYGAAGAAGSMLNLDPEQARKDLEPWARMSGGLTKASLDEMGVDLPKIADALGSGSRDAGETLESRLRGLHNLYKDGILSEEEYQREKQELLDEQ
jgi:hypothetical protein